MKISQAFPSKWLKVEDLKGRDLTVTIAKFQLEDVGGGDSPEEKPVIYFVGAKKGMVLNRTNAQAIAVYHGDDTDHWMGKKIILYEAMTQFQGRTVPCIRVRPVREAATLEAPESPPHITDDDPFPGEAPEEPPF